MRTRRPTKMPGTSSRLHNAYRNFSTAYILDLDNIKYFQHHKHNLVIFIIFNCLHIHTATHIMSRPDSSALSRGFRFCETLILVEQENMRK